MALLSYVLKETCYALAGQFTDLVTRPVKGCASSSQNSTIILSTILSLGLNQPCSKSLNSKDIWHSAASHLLLFNNNATPLWIWKLKETAQETFASKLVDFSLKRKKYFEPPFLISLKTYYLVILKHS